MVRWIPERVARLPKVRGVVGLLGFKPQHVDFYRYYEDVIISGDRGKWREEWADLCEELRSSDIDPSGISILDISGEPGFFAADGEHAGASVVVTAFADNVAIAMTDHLGLQAVTYDFQEKNLANKVSQKFDMVTVRYAIGFCEDLRFFTEEVSAVLRPGGYVYVSFSPSSRAVCARWMFDDYTYLRQWDFEYLRQTFLDSGYEEVARYDQGSYDWDSGVNPIAKWFSRRYLKEVFSSHSGPMERQQHNVAIIFRRGSA